MPHTKELKIEIEIEISLHDEQSASPEQKRAVNEMREVLWRVVTKPTTERKQENAAT